MASKRIVTVLGILSTVVVFAVARRTAGGDPTSGPQDDVRESEALVQLEDTLDQIKRAWNPRVKARVVAGARAKAEQLEEPLLWLLSNPRHDRLGEAIGLVSQLGLAKAHPMLVDLVDTAPESLQPAAVVAAGHLEPWSTEELMDLLRSEKAVLRAAAAESAADGPGGRTLELLIAMLEDPEASVRDAALEVFPRQMQGRERKEFFEWAGYADGPTEVWAIRAVGKIEFGEDSEALLHEKLRSMDRATRAAALDALSRKGNRLRQPNTVWAMAIYSHSDPVEQAKALYCLERTRSFSAGELRRELVFIQDPLPRFFAARCLITDGDKQGAVILIELLETEEVSFADGVDADAVRYAASALLGELSGLGPSAGLNELSDWVQGVAELGSRNLRAPDEIF